MKTQNRENLIFSYLALAFFVILVLTLVIMTYLDNKNSNVVVVDNNLVPAPKANVLTEEELQMELDLLKDSSLPTKIIEITDEIEAGSASGSKNVEQSQPSNIQKPIYSVETESNNPVSFSGNIFSIQNDIIVISNSEGLVRVKVNDQTKFSINGKFGDISTLRTAQKVIVEGFGDNTTRELVAKTVTITGEIQAISF